MNHEKLIKSMTLEEKVAMLAGAATFKSRGLNKYDIPFVWLSDGPHGLRKQAGAADHLGLNPSVKATCFPTAATMANSWDPALGEEVGVALGEESAAQGVGVLLGPGLNMKRNPLCGRNFEYFSEDPYLAGKMAASYVRGIQSQGVSACPKHYAANSQETRRMASNSVVDERSLREIYLTGFEIAVKEGKPWTIMTSYNLVNGTYASESEHLLMDILRKEWGYDQAIVTDWGGSNDHAIGIKNGSTLEMPAPGLDSTREVMAAVKSGKIKESDVDARLDEWLTIIDKTRAATKYAAEHPDEEPKMDVEGHHKLAARAAAETIVLLKNEGNILPLAAGTKVALIGDFAETPRYQGAGSSQVNVTKLDTLAECVKTSGLDCVGIAKGFDRKGVENDALVQEAAALAPKADVVLLCLGLTEIRESEGLDRGNMKLDTAQLKLFDAVQAANPNVVVLFHAGSSVELPFMDKTKAMVYAALGGQAGAGAILDVVTGKVNPSGKLTETWAYKYEDCSSADNFAGPGINTEYREGIYIGYRYYQKNKVPVQFPFGFGLSYTTFAYSDMTATEKGVSLKVTNTGKVAGKEVVELYVAKKGDSIVPRAVQTLCGFAKVALEPGETKTVEIPLDDKAFRYWNVKTNKWEIEPGEYELRAAASCEDVRATATVTLTGTKAPAPYDKAAIPTYFSGDVKKVEKAEFEKLLGQPVPDDKPKINRNLTFGQLNYSRSLIGKLVGLILNMLYANTMKGETPDLNILFVYNMPLRALAKMAGGMVSMGMVDAIVMVMQGWWLLTTVVGILLSVCTKLPVFWIIGVCWWIVYILFEFVKNMVLNSQGEARLK